MHNRRLLPVVAATAFALLTLSGCSLVEGVLPKPAETRDEQSGEIVGGGTTDVFTLTVGDCLDTASTTDDEVTDVPTVPCSTAHDAEVYADFELDDETWPGDDAATAEADAGCLAQFEAFVGLPFEESTLDYTFYWPTEASWNEGDDRLVTCLILDTEPTTGSLAGAAR